MKYYYDLHIHSALSPCGDDDMTPNNIVNMALINELDIIALSDHNTCGNVLSVAKVSKNSDIVFIPAMELETAEEIHVLCLFPNVDNALSFENDIVKPSLPNIKNNEKIFGKQVFYDEFDNEIGIDDRYLVNATTIGIDNLLKIICDYNGIAIPAHIDKHTKSLISVFGIVDENMGIDVFELSKNAHPDFKNTHFSLKGKNYTYIYDSDAHYLYDIAERGENNFFEFNTKPTPSDIIEMLKRQV